MTDWLALRARFPTLLERTYFATHSLGPLLRETLADLDDYRRTLPLRHHAIEAWYARVVEMRALGARLFGAEPDEIALGPNATACQAMFAAALVPRGERRVIVTTAMDFPSSRYLWHAQARRGFEVREVPAPGRVAMPTSAIVDAIDERTAIVAVPLVAYSNGALLDAARVCAAARAAGAITVLDAYQAAGVVPIDAHALGADALVTGMQKWLCGVGPGLALLYVRRALAESLEPAFPGWFAHTEPLAFADRFEPAPGARRFECGSPSVEAVYAARAGLAFALDVGVAQIRARSLALADRLVAGADGLGLRLATPRAHAQRAGVVCLAVDEPERIAAALGERGIECDTRPGTGLRFSCHPCLTESEVDRVLAELASLV